MTPNISDTLRRLVVERADNRCEFCRLSQLGQEATFHVDHVTPSVAGGETVEENLALACVGCSLRKGARQSAVDPDTGVEAPLFNPRTERWLAHFRWEGHRITGASPAGRATIEALALNRPMMIAIREEESFLGRHPGA